MTPGNLLIILSDEHNPDVMGCAGHPDIHTPNLDRLAAGGTRFVNAACASPICVPTRAALATGRNIFETGYWDNVDAYDGRTPSWHHVLRAAGHEVVSIGKLHYRGWQGDDYGWSESLLPMHIHGGRGETKMLLRNPPAFLGDGSNMLDSARAGESNYNKYDEQICTAAEAWLRAHARQPAGQAATAPAVPAAAAKPWVLMVSMVAPHFPLTVPAPFFDLYRGKDLRLPKDYRYGIDPQAHPFIQQYAAASGYNLHFKTDDDVRRALAGYYGLVSFMDHKVGRLLDTLASSGLAETTRVLYLSDHGENAGARGLWGKGTMHRESVGIPLITSGPGIGAGRTESAAVSHIDLYNTVLDAVGAPAELSTASPRSQSLLRPLAADRTVLAEYHTVGSRAALFMLQDARAKYVHYCDHVPQFFDLAADPAELRDLGTAASHAPVVQAWRARLEALLSPDAVDARAKQRQADLITLYGGAENILAGSGIGGYTPSPVA